MVLIGKAGGSTELRGPGRCQGCVKLSVLFRLGAQLKQPACGRLGAPLVILVQIDLMESRKSAYDLGNPLGRRALFDGLDDFKDVIALDD